MSLQRRSSARPVPESAQAVFWITVDDEITETSTPILARPSRCASGSIICLNQMSRRDPGVRGGSAMRAEPRHHRPAGGRLEHLRLQDMGVKIDNEFFGHSILRSLASLDPERAGRMITSTRAQRPAIEWTSLSAGDAPHRTLNTSLPLK